jgi:hypothetical protein
MLNIDNDDLFDAAVGASIFLGCLLLVAWYATATSSVCSERCCDRFCCCCRLCRMRREEEAREFATLNDLLLEVNSDEAGRVLTEASSRNMSEAEDDADETEPTERKREKVFTLSSFFPNILLAKRESSEEVSEGEDGSQEPLVQTN